MTSNIGSQPIGHENLEDYKSALEKYTIQTSPDACSQSYVRVSKLREWWKSDTNFQGTTTSQATRWLDYAYRQWPVHSHFNHMSKDKLMGSNPCVLIFSILLEIGWGDLIHLFRLVKHGPLDDSLPFREPYLKFCFQKMSELVYQRPRDIPVDIVSILFFQAQWKYCPAAFIGEFEHLEPLTIIPIHRKELISDKGGTAKLYQIEVLSEFVGGTLRQAAKDFEYTPMDNPDGLGSVC